MIAAWWRIRSVEAPLWVYLAKLWSSSSGQSAVAATNAFREMDHWSQDAGCGTIPSLYALMLSSNDRSLVVDGFDEDVAESLTRASYALLSTPALLKPAVIGLDANIDDAALIEEAVDKAEDEGDAPDGDAPDGSETPCANRWRPDPGIRCRSPPPRRRRRRCGNSSRMRSRRPFRFRRSRR